MKIIPLTQGYTALVDDTDYPRVSGLTWHVVKKGKRRYAARRMRKSEGSQKIQYLHQFLCPGSVMVDHEDGEGLDNRRHNLRPCTSSQNIRAFKRKASGKSSKFRGVSWDTARGKWKAKLNISGKTIHLGRFDCERAAAGAYDLAAIRYFGEFATKNIL